MKRILKVTLGFIVSKHGISRRQIITTTKNGQNDDSSMLLEHILLFEHKQKDEQIMNNKIRTSP